MRVIIADNYKEMSKKAAVMVSSQVILKHDSVLGLATGDTPLGMYKELIKLYEDKEVDFSGVTTFNLDEYYKIQRENPESYYYYMNNNFFKYVNVKKEKIYIPNGTAKDIDEECRNYEDEIKNKGGIDIQILGIGANGHIGFNEPDVNFEAETHLVKLDKMTIEANSRFFNSKDEVPTTAISMGIKTIMQSKRVVLLANGEVKADAIYKTVKGKICPEVPASILQLHSDATIIVDKGAAKLL
ncbi:glucosamine-6-phosphate deaminase [Clostridium coskatii]|uniref:Glucosamine-6-phosphate deaminase n=1 Tax=Clostridium coskatii TaxID=1705578 RepID=A0A166T395_9CLOT|nr:glucosamine-6-phosphate deaminase [Clostridium coskatii]OAA93128.1 Glucosamine-6-phosphate deaminase 1 [Clostridium coskatii]OBR90871.1 glucosamine-6-phosphate deaminase 1 [Clostridium coskatii]